MAPGHRDENVNMDLTRHIAGGGSTNAGSRIFSDLTQVRTAGLPFADKIAGIGPCFGFGYFFIPVGNISASPNTTINTTAAITKLVEAKKL